MGAPVLLNFLTNLGKDIKCEACRAVYVFFATVVINSIIQEHECYSIYHMTLKLIKNRCFGVNTSTFCHIGFATDQPFHILTMITQRDPQKD